MLLRLIHYDLIKYSLDVQVCWRKLYT